MESGLYMYMYIETMLNLHNYEEFLPLLLYKE